MQDEIRQLYRTKDVAEPNAPFDGYSVRNQLITRRNDLIAF